MEPPPDMITLLQEERRIQQQLYRQSISSEADSAENNEIQSNPVDRLDKALFLDQVRIYLLALGFLFTTIFRASIGSLFVQKRILITRLLKAEILVLNWIVAILMICVGINNHLSLTVAKIVKYVFFYLC